MGNLMPPLPLEAMIAIAILFAALVAPLTEVSKKFGAKDGVCVAIALALGQALTVSYWYVNELMAPKALWFGVTVGLIASVMAIGLWKAVRK